MKVQAGRKSTDRPSERTCSVQSARRSRPGNSRSQAENRMRSGHSMKRRRSSEVKLEVTKSRTSPVSSMVTMMP